MYRRSKFFTFLMAIILLLSATWNIEVSANEQQIELSMYYNMYDYTQQDISNDLLNADEVVGRVSILCYSATYGYEMANAEFGIYEDDSQGTSNNISTHMPPYTVVTTDYTGNTGDIVLPVGFYFVKLMGNINNHVMNQAVKIQIMENRTLNIIIQLHEETIVPTPTPQQPNIADEGTLILIKRATGTRGEFLSGAVYEIRRQLDSQLVGTIQTDYYGEATIHLPQGDYFAREIIAPYGYILDPVRINFRINSGRATTLNPTNRKEEVPEETKNGLILVIKRASDTRELLSGAIFEVRRQFDNVYMGTLVTDHYGEDYMELYPGSYYLREMAAPAGFTEILDRINFTVKSSGVTTEEVSNTRIKVPTPTPRPTEAPAPTPLPLLPNGQQPNGNNGTDNDNGENGNGRLMITNREQGTSTAIDGAVFEIYEALHNRLVGEVTTDIYGDASAFLPQGDYFVRQVSVPRKYILNPIRNTVRIEDGKLAQLNITNEIGEEHEDYNEESGNGRLLLIQKAHDTGLPLENVIYELRDALTEELISLLITDAYGEASISLPKGDYYVRQKSPPDGHVLLFDRINARIVGGQITEIEIGNDATTPANNPKQGRLLVTVMGDDTKRLQGANISIHHVMTDEVIQSVKTNEYGEVSMFLPIGNYYFRKTSVPNGYIKNVERINFTIHPAEMTDMIIVARKEPPPTPTPEAIEIVEDLDEGIIEIITRAMPSGKELTGGVYGIYRASDSKFIENTIIKEDGVAKITVPPGLYFIKELRPTYGYILEESSIYVEVTKGVILRVEITKDRDENILEGSANVDGVIFVPQTGQDISKIRVLGGVTSILVSLLLLVWFMIYRIGIDFSHCAMVGYDRAIVLKNKSTPKIKAWVKKVNWKK